MRRLAARVTRMIYIDQVWLAADPLDMRAGFNTALGRVITVFAAHPHHAYLFANVRQRHWKLTSAASFDRDGPNRPATHVTNGWRRSASWLRKAQRLRKRRITALNAGKCSRTMSTTGTCP